MIWERVDYAMMVSIFFGEVSIVGYHSSSQVSSMTNTCATSLQATTNHVNPKSRICSTCGHAHSLGSPLLGMWHPRASFLLSHSNITPPPQKHRTSSSLTASSSFLTWLMVEPRVFYLFLIGCYFSIGLLYQKCLLTLLSPSLKLLPLFLKNWMGKIICLGVPLSWTLVP